MNSKNVNEEDGNLEQKQWPTIQLRFLLPGDNKRKTPTFQTRIIIILFELFFGEFI